MKLVVLITPNIEHGIDIANRWQEAGASGVTIIKGTGLYSLQQKAKRGSVEVPLHIASSMTSMLAYLLSETEQTNNVLLSLVPNNLVSTMLDTVKEVRGEEHQPNMGVAFVVPVDETLGVYGPDDSDES